MHEAETLQQQNRTYVLHRGRRLSYFGGCDYFRLSSHPRILKAINEGLARYGLNVAASRVTTGNHRLYQQLERKLAQHFGAETALLASSGYVTNLLVAQTLAGRFSHALVDERAHLALRDAAQLLNCPVLTFQHREPSSLASTLKRCGHVARPIVLTDGMFSGDGAVAPLAAYRRLLPRDGWLLVDDAHGIGTVGKTGRGSVELENVRRDRLIQNITLSKALGVYGGAILCSHKLRQDLLASRMFVGSTPLPLPLAFAAIRSVEMLRQDRSLLHRLEANTATVRSGLSHAGFNLAATPGPIIPLHFAEVKQVRRLKLALLRADILPPFINYHGGPADGYFRFVISSEHTPKQLRELVRTLTPFAPGSKVKDRSAQ